MWHAERVPLSSDWWLKLLPSSRPENTWILEIACKLQRCGRGCDWAELRADKWQRSRTRYWHPPCTTCSYSGACHCTTSSGCKAALSSRNQSLEFLKRACNFYESRTVIYKNIIPAVYVVVIDLFMKTAIVLRSVRGSQTTELTSSGSHCSMNAMKSTSVDRPSLQTKPLFKTKLPHVKNGLVPSAVTLVSSCSQLSWGLKGGWLSVIFYR